MAANRDEALHRVNARRWRVGGALTAVMMVGYFAFILLVAFAKSTVGALVGDASVGILLGASVIVLAPLLTMVYVRWANRVYDPQVESLRSASTDEES
ncbi:MAG: DUF485 domain-containing protein [Kofleriaceae bacterium]